MDDSAGDTTEPTIGDSPLAPNPLPPVSLSPDEELAWIALSLLRHLGGKTFRTLLSHFDDKPSQVLAADAKTLRRVRGIGPKISEAIQAIELEIVRRQLDRWGQLGILTLPAYHPNYPSRLKPIEDAPPTLFAIGQQLDKLSAGGVAIVGTRQPEALAFYKTRDIAAYVAEREGIVISGMALGIDEQAHLGALAVPHGVTMAVLGSGVLNPYPPENRELARAIYQRGAVISELSPEASVSTPGLVARNRLITGLVDAVVVVETRADGGAMHAARFAKMQGKRLFVVENGASGNQQLLAEGAIPLGDNFDVLLEDA